MFRFEAALIAAAFAASMGACARPATQLGTTAPQPASTEHLRPQELVIESDLRQQQRVDDVGHALLAAATPICGSARAPRAGVRFANVHSFSGEYQEAARSLGFTDTLVIVGVTQGSTAARSGFSVGDRVVAVNGGPPPRGPDAVAVIARELMAQPTNTPRLTLEQGPARFLADDNASDNSAAGVGGRYRVAMPADTVCGYNLVAMHRDDLGAWADGANVGITSAMVRFITDDDELAALLAHEIAHNVLRHVQANESSKEMGGRSGAIVDISFATQATSSMQGVTARGESATTFSADVELEVDSVAMSLLARAGRPTAKAAVFWRRIARENPGGVAYATTHPTTVGRFVRLEELSTELDGKTARREEPRPEVPGASLSSSAAVAQAPAKKPTSANRAAPTTATVLVDRGTTSSTLVVPKSESAATQASSAGDVALISTTTIVRGDTVTYTFGSPVPRNGWTLAQVRRHAIEAFDDGREALELRLYEQAEAKFREAILYDGSVARYHASLGAILLKRGKRAEAETVLSAAVLLDVENAEYRELLLEARKR